MGVKIMQFPTNKTNNNGIKKIMSDLSLWCDNYRGFVNHIFCEQITMEEKITKLFWVVKQIGESQISLGDNFNELYEWVSDYFENLDIQSELNIILNEMLEDGRLNDIIGQFFKGGMGIVSPMQYGAVGDGVADDSEAVSQASKDGIILDIKHTFYIGENCLIENGVMFTSFKIAPGKVIRSNGDILYNNFTNSNTTDTNRGQFSVETYSSNVRIIGNIFHDMINALAVREADNVIVSNNTFKNIVQTNVSEGNGYGLIALQANYLIIENNQFIDVARHSIYLSTEVGLKGCEYTKISGNIFNKKNAIGVSSGFETEIYIRNGKHITIESNIMSNILGGITLQGNKFDANDVLCSDITIRDNTFNSIANPYRPTQDGVIVYNVNDAAANIDNIYIIDNAVNNSQVNFVKASDAINQRIDGNSFHCSKNGMAFLYMIKGLLSNQNNSYVVSNNRVVNNSGYFMYKENITIIKTLNVYSNNVNANYFVYGLSGSDYFSRILFINNYLSIKTVRQGGSNGSVKELVSMGNTGDAQILIDLVPLQFISSGQDYIAFKEGVDNYKTLTTKNPASTPFFSAEYMRGDALEGMGYDTVANLPTINVRPGQYAVTKDSKVSFFNGSAWITLN